jgi:hypothetical protein
MASIQRTVWLIDSDLAREIVPIRAGEVEGRYSTIINERIK